MFLFPCRRRRPRSPHSSPADDRGDTFDEFPYHVLVSEFAASISHGSNAVTPSDERTIRSMEPGNLDTLSRTGGDEPEALPASSGGGADVLVSIISSTWNEINSTLQMRAYSVATTSCNAGTEPLEWFGGNNRHPVIGQNMFRLAPRQNGHLRFEQLGQSWLKHGFCALDLDFGECTGCSQNLGCNLLGVGCEDPYTAARNASQSSAGPKYQVNASTGFFPYPPANPSWSGNMARRLQVPLSDVQSSQNPGAQYVIEVQYVHPQDAPSANWSASLNNASYRVVTLNSGGSMTGYVGDTVKSQPGIHFWKAVDPQVTLTAFDAPHLGRMMVGSRAYDNGDGTWDYEYAVYNMHFDRGVGTFSVPMPAGAVVTDIEFRDVKYHSGEAFEYNGTEGHWPVTVADGTITWTTPQTYQENINSNAIRWGTVYNFRFTADVEPEMGEATLIAFNPFPFYQPDTFLGEAQVPAMPKAAPCPADLSGDGVVDFTDLLIVLSAWGPCAGCPEDLDGDGDVTFGDLLILLANWGDCEDL